MGEIALKVLKVAQVVLIVGLSGGVIALLALFGDEFDTLGHYLTTNRIWSYLLRGISIGKWLFGGVPMTIMIDAFLAYTGFVFGSRAVSFVKTTFFDR